jgi:Na+-transporting methylmalonyl-CoA/oxaloacetate decarboxylase beta subunit
MQIEIVGQNPVATGLGTLSIELTGLTLLCLKYIDGMLIAKLMDSTEFEALRLNPLIDFARMIDNQYSLSA